MNTIKVPEHKDFSEQLTLAQARLNTEVSRSGLGFQEKRSGDSDLLKQYLSDNEPFWNMALSALSLPGQKSLPHKEKTGSPIQSIHVPDMTISFNEFRSRGYTTA